MGAIGARPEPRTAILRVQEFADDQFITKVGYASFSSAGYASVRELQWELCRRWNGHREARYDGAVSKRITLIARGVRMIERGFDGQLVRASEVTLES